MFNSLFQQLVFEKLFFVVVVVVVIALKIKVSRNLETY